VDSYQRWRRVGVREVPDAGGDVVAAVDERPEHRDVERPVDRVHVTAHAQLDQVLGGPLPTDHVAHRHVGKSVLRREGTHVGTASQLTVRVEEPRERRSRRESGEPHQVDRSLRFACPPQ
jgi:hypothetical protein